MATKVWLGTTSTSFDTAGNWSPAGVPADGDDLVYDERATQSCLSGLTQAGKTFAMYVGSGFTHYIGGDGNHLTPDAFSDVFWGAGAGAKGWLEAGSTDIDRLICDTDSTVDNALNIDGDVDILVIRRGKVAMVSGGEISTHCQVGTGDGRQSAKLTIPSGCTVNGAVFRVDGGELITESNMGTINQSGGEVKLDGSATLSLLNASGGTFYWASTGTITEFHIRGNARFDAAEYPGERTLTTGYIYDQATYTERDASNLITRTNGIYAYGANAPLFKHGANYA